MDTENLVQMLSKEQRSCRIFCKDYRRYGYVGFDCDGTLLKPGDKVRIVRAIESTKSYKLGTEGQIKNYVRGWILSIILTDDQVIEVDDLNLALIY